jgi:chemotaxis family two-component system sensor kinase Cph1
MTSLDRLEDHDILEKLIGVRQGDHLHVLYEDSPLEQLPEVLAFLREGLDSGELCVYAADDTSPGELEDWLSENGIDAASAVAQGALLLWTREQWGRPGALDTVKKASHIQETVDAAVLQGFTGVRFVVEMTWTLRPGSGSSDIQEWEAPGSHPAPGGQPVRAICLYGRRFALRRPPELHADYEVWGRNAAQALRAPFSDPD